MEGMEQRSAIYGIAIIRSHETTLLGRERMQRLVASSETEALRLLQDAGYGATHDTSEETDIERRIENELNAAYALVNEVSSDYAQTNILLMRSDIQNLKILLKLKALNSKDAPVYARGGIYPTEMLRSMVQSGDYREMPETIANVLTEIEESIALERVNPMLISVKLDRAYNNYAREQKNPFLKEYFSAKADFDNLLTVLRMRKRGHTGLLEELLLTPGDISLENLALALTLPFDNFLKVIDGASGYEYMRKAMGEIAAGAPVTVLERERDNYLIFLASLGKEDIDTIRPIVGYLLAREQEAKCVRLIMTAKHNGLDEIVIGERMRVLYGEG